MAIALLSLGNTSASVVENRCKWICVTFLVGEIEIFSVL